MLKQTVRYALVLSVAFLIGAQPCWAKAKGYLYVVSYSFAKKKAYLSNVIIQQVRDISYSDEEYVTEVELIQKIESRFLRLMASSANIDPEEFTTSVKGAYKSKNIADFRLNTDRKRYLKKGYAVIVLSDFVYSD